MALLSLTCFLFFSRPRPPFWGPLAAILDFAGGAAMQAVSERPLRREAGIFSVATVSHRRSARIKKLI